MANRVFGGDGASNGSGDGWRRRQPPLESPPAEDLHWRDSYEHAEEQQRRWMDQQDRIMKTNEEELKRRKSNATYSYPTPWGFPVPMTVEEREADYKRKLAETEAEHKLALAKADVEHRRDIEWSNRRRALWSAGPPQWLRTVGWVGAGLAALYFLAQIFGGRK